MKIFKVNELNSATYISASKKLIKMGGIHAQRGRDIEDWDNQQKHIRITKKYEQIGEFNLNVHIVNTYDKRKQRSFMELAPHITDASKQSMISRLPTPCYFTGFYIFNELEMMADLPDNSLIISACFSNLKASTIEAFNIEIPISWDNETFKISGEAQINFAYNEFEEKILFSDRKSAFKFKSKVLSNVIEYINNKDELRELFMSLSDSNEYDKISELISKIPVNSLYI